MFKALGHLRGGSYRRAQYFWIGLWELSPDRLMLEPSLCHCIYSNTSIFHLSIKGLREEDGRKIVRILTHARKRYQMHNPKAMHFLPLLQLTLSVSKQYTMGHHHGERHISISGTLDHAARQQDSTNGFVCTGPVSAVLFALKRFSRRARVGCKTILRADVSPCKQVWHR